MFCKTMMVEIFGFLDTLMPVYLVLNILSNHEAEIFDLQKGGSNLSSFGRFLQRDVCQIHDS